MNEQDRSLLARAASLRPLMADSANDHERNSNPSSANFMRSALSVVAALESRLAAILREPQPESNPSMASNSSPPYRLPETKSIKCQQPYFDAILSGEKTFEIRKNDRDYRAGDRLNLREWDDDAGEYTGREQAVDVLYRMPGGRWGIPADYCVMSIRLVQPEPAPEVPAGGALLYACNACEWVGEWVNTVHPKHDPNHLLCPECNETIQPYTVAMIAAAIRKPEVSDE